MTENVVGQEHLHASDAAIEEVELLRTTWHTVIKALEKFTLIGLRHDDTRLLTCLKPYTTFL